MTDMIWHRGVKAVAFRVESAVDRLIPARFPRSSEEFRRARLVAFVIVAVFLISCLMCAKYHFEGAREIRGRVLVCLALQPLSLLVLRFSGSARAAGHLFCAMMWLLFCGIASLSGGLDSPNMVSNTVVVLMAVMLIGPRHGLVWLGIVTAGYVGFYLLTAQGLLVRQTLSSDYVRDTRLGELIATAVASTIIAYAYETGKQRMLAALTLEKAQVETAHRDIRLMLDSTGQGFVSLDPQGRVTGEHSAVIELWLGRPEPLQPFHAFLARHDQRLADMFNVGWQAVEEDVMPLMVTLDQLPKQLRLGAQTLACEYRPLMAPSGALEKVVMIISDITAQVASDQALSRQRDLFAAFTRILKDGDGFSTFVRDARAAVKHITAPESSRVEVARALHTLKGNAGMMELVGLSTLCGRLEEELSEAGQLKPESLEDLSAELAQSEQLLEMHGSAVGDERIALSEQEYRGFLSRLSRAHAERALLDEVQLWRLPSVGQELRRLADHARTLARRLSKGDLELQVEDSGLRLDSSERWRDFWSGLVHVVRNAVDHGVEAPEERRAAGKARARLRFAAKLQKSELVVEVADDGRGLDWERVRERCRALGLPCETPEDLKDALFRDGVTTRDAVTEISGRGVDLAAVRGACDGLKGRIEIESEPRSGTTWRFIFPTAGVRVGAIASGTAAPSANGAASAPAGAA